MSRASLFSVFLFLFFPCFGFGFSEIEIDFLESTGQKSLSSSPWRVQIGFSLQRNLLVDSSLLDSQELRQQRDAEDEDTVLSNLFDPYRDTSLLDPSNLYYVLSLNLNYSLKGIAEDLQYEWLKNTELFLNNSFNSAFKPSNINVEGYNFIDYVQYALGDVIGGFTVPAYNKGDFLSSFSFSFIAFPLSRYSREAGLSTTVDGAINLLYFLKKAPKWNVALSFNHSQAYNHYKKDFADTANYNVPYDTNQSLSLVFRQSLSKHFPSSTQVSASHYFGINTYKTRLHDLTLSSSFSWKVKDRLYFNFSISWKDRVNFYNPYDKEVIKIESIRFNLAHTFFVIGGSYLL